MRENCTSGSARGVPGNRHSYRRESQFGKQRCDCRSRCSLVAQGLGSTGDWRIQGNGRQALGKEGSLLAYFQLLAQSFHIPKG